MGKTRKMLGWMAYREGADEKLPTSSVSGAFMLGDVNITQARQWPDCLLGKPGSLKSDSLFSYRCLNSLQYNSFSRHPCPMRRTTGRLFNVDRHWPETETTRFYSTILPIGHPLDPSRRRPFLKSDFPETTQNTKKGLFLPPQSILHSTDSHDQSFPFDPAGT